ncbi:MAG TPA: thiolase family protein [Blastocatellia bacterium]|nr:thiolase family protein [Blastocatellia bacterium]
MSEVFFAASVRTPIGKFGGTLKDWTAADLCVAVVQESLRRASLEPNVVDEVIIGCARQAGGGPNVARQIGYRAGMPETVPAFTVNQACGSGLKAVILAAQEIMLGRARCVVAGGTESMSRVPYLAEGTRWGLRMGNAPLVDGMYRDGFLDPLSGQVMGETAETLARQYDISRREQDEYALRSQLRAEAATSAGYFQGEIVPLTVTDRKGNAVAFATDEHARAGATMESLAKLPPVFAKDGTVTAGNSSGITDGAAALVVLSGDAAKTNNVAPQARLVDYEIVGVDPRVMGIGPVPAIRRLLARRKMTLDDIGLVELNEAFAAQVLACDRELHFDPERLNVNGGAIALGHPIGCTGARILTTLMHEIERRGVRYGLATLCISGGMGIALLVERV